MPTGYMTSMPASNLWGSDLLRASSGAGQTGTPDSYLSQLQSTLGQMMSGNMFPQTTSEVGVKVQRLTPEEEQGAYNTSGFQGLLDNPNFGQISDEQLKGYYNLSQPYMFNTGMENINQILSQAGWAPGGANGQAPAGTQAEMAARLQAQLGSQVAQGLIENSRAGATARGNLGANVAASRYGTLTVPNVFSMSQGTKPGAGATGVQQNPSTIGTGSNTYAGGNTSNNASGGGFSAMGGSASPGGGTSGGGGSTGGGGTAPGSTASGSSYREPTPWEIESNWQRLYGGRSSPSPESDYWTPESGGSGPYGAGTSPYGQLTNPAGWSTMTGYNYEDLGREFAPGEYVLDPNGVQRKWGQ